MCLIYISTAWWNATNLLPTLLAKYWNWCHKCGAVLLEHRKNFTGLNHAFLTLIPKVKNPEKVSDFRPIALCYILYKLISKVLANRLKTFLPQIIFESQSTFQADKAILDNILVAFEILHHMKTKKMGKTGFMAMKLDMSKAYDKVEWQFLVKIMERMRFHSKWIGWIYECVSFVSFSIIVNGEPRGHIVPTKGLRQGDHLSPISSF